MATQPGREQLLAIGYAIFLAHGVQPGGLPGFVQSLDDESGHTRLELIGVRLEPAMLGLHESESKGVEGLLCAQPNEATLQVIDIGFVGIGRSEERRVGKECWRTRRLGGWRAN